MAALALAVAEREAGGELTEDVAVVSATAGTAGIPLVDVLERVDGTAVIVRVIEDGVERVVGYKGEGRRGEDGEGCLLVPREVS